MPRFRIFVSETIERIYTCVVEAASPADADAIATLALERDDDIRAWTIAETSEAEWEERPELTQLAGLAPVVPITRPRGKRPTDEDTRASVERVIALARILGRMDPEGVRTVEDLMKSWIDALHARRAPDA
jgi:hypothetical protein